MHTYHVYFTSAGIGMDTTVQGENIRQALDAAETQLARLWEPEIHTITLQDS